MKVARTLLSIIALSLALWLAATAGGLAQQTDDTEPAASFTREELTQMLAPMALYPDAVLSQVLMASTYPIEVIEAQRWIKDHPELQGDSLDNALLEKDWDPSVKSLCHFPNLLTMMSDKIAETTNLGNAFLAQEDEIMDVIQELRSKAFDQGSLSSNQKQDVIVENQTIIIKPVNPEVVYVPYYDPYYVYGSWWYPDYPPYYWGPAGVPLGAGIYFWPTPYYGFAIGSWSYFDWPRHYVIIDVHRRPKFFRHDEWRDRRGTWRHIPTHRRGVAYRDMPTARKFGQAPGRVRNFDRRIRGFPESAPDRRQGRPNRPNRATPPRDNRINPPLTSPRPQQRITPPPGGRDNTAVRQQPRSVPQLSPQEQRIRQSIEQQRQQQARERVQQQRQNFEQLSPQEQRIRQSMEQQRQQQARERAQQQQQSFEQLSPVEQRLRQRIEQQRSSPEQEGGNAFNRVEEGRDETQFSTRGRSSRGSGRRGGRR